MPLETIFDISGAGKAGIWLATEPLAFFENKVELTDQEKTTLHFINTQSRKLEWYASRHLLHLLTSVPDRWVLLKDNFGKPYFQDQRLHCSISHTGKYVTAMVGELPCGIDMQSVEKRIEKMISRFLSEQEISTIPEKELGLYGTLYWSAKEAVYKAYGLKSLSFRENILIEPFIRKDKNYYTKAFINKSGEQSQYILNGFSIGENVLLTAIRL